MSNRKKYLAYYSYTECLESRAYAMAHRTSSPNKFVPRCRSDGTYAAVQCMGGAGCWCSDGQGKPIPNTTTTNGKPVCPKIGRVNMRRSPARQQQQHMGGPGGGFHFNSNNNDRNRRQCKRADQRLFNSNLVKKFYNEYMRLNPSTTMAIVTDKTVLDWKFSMLDSNKDEKLDKIEYKELRRLVRKVSISINQKILLKIWTSLPFNCRFSFSNYSEGSQTTKMCSKFW